MFRARIEAGKLTFGTQSMRMAFSAFAADHPGAIMILTPEKHIRTTSQQAFYWVYLGVIERETGENANELHEFFKRKFLPPVFRMVRGEEIEMPRTTKTLSKSEFSEYLDKIAALTEIPLPDPKEAGYVSNHA